MTGPSSHTPASHTPIGASAKLARARELRESGALNAKGAFLRTDSNSLYAGLVIVTLAVAVAWRLGDILAGGAVVVTGIAAVDTYVLAAAPAYTGDAALDPWLSLVVRSLCVLMVAGFLPLISWSWLRVINVPLASPYRTMWGVTLMAIAALLFFAPFLTLLASLGL